MAAYRRQIENVRVHEVTSIFSTQMVLFVQFLIYFLGTVRDMQPALREQFAGLQPVLRAVCVVRLRERGLQLVLRVRLAGLQPVLRAVFAGKRRTLVRTGKPLHALYIAHAHFYVLGTIRGESAF